MERGIVARKGWLWGVLSLVLCLALVSSAVAPALAEDAEGGCDDCLSYPIMRPDRETLERWIEAYNNAPRAYIEMEGFQVPSPRGSLSLLDNLEYTPAERNQGTCGNCWAWAGTGCLGIALHVQEGIKDRLSVQYINSCEGTVIGKTCCTGGWLSDLADFYDATDMAIPWSNTNAHWQDGDASCDTACGLISTDPNYPITAIQEQVVPTLPTDGVTDQATAIANIKNVLGQDKAVWFAFYLPNNTAWNNLFNFWDYSAETVVYDMDQFCGTPYDDSPGEGGGHAVLCVGYNDEVPENSYWIMLNSWGTTAGRPNGLFRIDMDMDYQCVNAPYYSFYWQTLDVTFDIVDQPDITVDPTSFEVTLPPDTTQDYTLTIGNDGDAELNYTISDRETPGGGTGSATPAGLAPHSIPPDKANADEHPLFEESSPRPSPAQEYVPNQLIVKFKDNVTSAAAGQLNQSLGTEVIYTSRYAGFKVLQAPQGKTVAEMVDLYLKQSIVEYAEPNYIRHATWSPDDLYYSYQWHFDQINMEAAWDLDTTPPNYGGDPSIVVAVIDSGVAYETYDGYVQAPDLASTTFTTGYDFVNTDAHPNDDNNHGTHVCGTVAQSTNNGLGVAGIAFNTAIMPVKVLNSAGSGTDAQMADGVYYATDNGAHIINMSLGGESPSTTMENAVAYAYNQGVTIVAAAGNDYEEGNDPQYPAAYDDYCIAVGATRYDQTRAPYSNTGSYLDIAAPGGDLSVDQNADGQPDGVLQQTFAVGDPTDFGYWFFDGTSMACPHVAGVAALILAKNPSFTPDQVRQALESTATDLGTPGRDDEYGWGLLNAPAAISWTVSNTPPNTPADPSPADQATDVSVNAGLNWTGDDPDPDDTVTYDVYFDTVGATTLVSENQSANTYNPGTLSHNTTYYWKIVAMDNHGASTSGPVWEFTTTEAEDCPWLSVNSTSGSVAPGESHNITVSINTTGLGSNYTAEIVIASNDPDEDPLTVPVTLDVTPPGPTLELVDDINIIPYTGATTTLPEALTNIEELVEIIWARGAWTGGEWYTFYFFSGVPKGNLEELEDGRAYIIVVSELCNWELP